MTVVGKDERGMMERKGQMEEGRIEKKRKENQNKQWDDAFSILWEAYAANPTHTPTHPYAHTVTHTHPHVRRNLRRMNHKRIYAYIYMYIYKNTVQSVCASAASSPCGALLWPSSSLLSLHKLAYTHWSWNLSQLSDMPQQTEFVFRIQNILQLICHLSVSMSFQPQLLYSIHKLRSLHSLLVCHRVV